MSADKKVIGRRLREVREEPPYWTRGDLARLLRDAATPEELPYIAHVPSLEGMIKQWENGRYTPSRRYRFLYARVTGRSEAELFGSGASTAAPWRADGLNGAFTPEDEERLVLAARRPSRVDLTVVDSLATILAGHRRTEDAVGSAPLVEPVRTSLAVLEGLVTGARGPIRPKVVNVAAQWAQFFGWLKANVGDLAVGKGWLDRALEWAIETDDANLISEVLSFKGHVAWMAGQPGPMIGLSAAALRGDGLYPGQYAISAAQEARGHAMVGAAYETERLLDRADEEAAAARERLEEAPPWLYYHSPGFFELQRGLAYRYLGRHDRGVNHRAVEALSRGLGTLPAGMRDSEWAGEFVYQLGRAHAQAGELERAVALGEDLAELAEQIDSSRLAGQAAELR
ncbi:helix-turn-helix domain-containing protein [Actinomadura rubrisoli]|uniref:XRE family transcriptional regulator n=1 Tax=Actinomadura rubrisoli TaxID=2530368 RepID=A0A4R4ZW74_9ACTN|nr:helix-turn-helix transcriptional regulator [Actinomadura rubrisoli]TDD63175.1 XRE family transcriptional regulator [Actinomadura rubrisoli]